MCVVNQNQFASNHAAMTETPRELIDELAAFACGVRSWGEWPSWFAIRAKRLSRSISADRFGQLKVVPKQAVPRLLADEGYFVRTTRREASSSDAGPVTEVEYGIYSAVLRLSDLLVFDRPGTTFEDRTSSDNWRFEPMMLQLSYDVECREFAPKLCGLHEFRAESFEPWFRRSPEIFAQFEARNRQRWPLEPRFESPAEYRLVPVSEKPEIATGDFCFSRVGFSVAGDVALVYVRCSVAGCYVVLERRPSEWERVDQCMAFIV